MATAVAVLDMLDDFITGKLANPASEKIVESIAALIEMARNRDGWLVVYSNDAHQPGDLELAAFGEHAMAGTPGAQVAQALAPHDGDIVVPKRFYSAFTETDLEATCRVQNIDRLVLTGQHTECCCRHTSYDAFRRGIDLVAIADATAAYEPLAGASYGETQNRALAYLRTYYCADVTDTSALV